MGFSEFHIYDQDIDIRCIRAEPRSVLGHPYVNILQRGQTIVTLWVLIRNVARLSVSEGQLYRVN